MSTTITRYWPNVVDAIAAALNITRVEALSYWAQNADSVYRVWRYIAQNPGLTEGDLIAAAGASPSGGFPAVLAGLDAELVHRALVLGDLVSQMQSTGTILPPIAIVSAS